MIFASVLASFIAIAVYAGISVAKWMLSPPLLPADYASTPAPSLNKVSRLAETFGGTPGLNGDGIQPNQLP